jgi:hypothetical protein
MYAVRCSSYARFLPGFDEEAGVVHSIEDADGVQFDSRGVDRSDALLIFYGAFEGAQHATAVLVDELDAPTGSRVEEA